MNTLSTIRASFVIKAVLSTVAVGTACFGVSQAALSFQAFANADHARQATYIELASQSK